MEAIINSIQTVLITRALSLLDDYPTNSSWLIIFRWYISSVTIISFLMARKCLKNIILEILRSIYIWSKMNFTLINFNNGTKSLLMTGYVFYWLINALFLDCFRRIILSLDISTYQFFIWSLRDVPLLCIYIPYFEIISCLRNKSLLRPYYSLMKCKSGWFLGSFFCSWRPLNLNLAK